MAKKERIVPLAFHSAYTFGHGVSLPQRLAPVLAENDFHLLPLTDTLSFCALVQTIKAAKEHGLQAFPGIHVPVIDGEVFLYPSDETGFRGICELTTSHHHRFESPLEQEWPTKKKLSRVSDLFERLPGGVRAIGVGAGGLEVLKHTGATVRKSWGITRNSHLPRLNREAELARSVGAPPVAMPRLITVSAADRELRAVLQAIHFCRRVDEVAGFQVSPRWGVCPEKAMDGVCVSGLFSDFVPLPTSPEQMSALWGWFPESISGNMAFAAEPCWLPPLGEFHMPRVYDDPEESRQKLRHLTIEGLRRKYREISPEVVTRFEREFQVLCQKNFTDYFLAVHEIVVEAQRLGHRVLGRGSAANSIISYALNITHVDPLKYGLFFERFLNPSRPTPPDIDLDFSWRLRDDIYEFLISRWGASRVAMISTHVTLGGRGALRQTAKALGYPFRNLADFSRILGWRLLRDLLNDPARAADVQRYLPRDPESEPVLRLAMQIEGLPTHLSLHAGGVVISPTDLSRFTPCQPSSKVLPMTQMEMHAIEDVGLVKIDLLAQRSLGVYADLTKSRSIPGNRDSFEIASSLPLPAMTNLSTMSLRAKRSTLQKRSIHGTLRVLAIPGGHNLASETKVETSSRFLGIHGNILDDVEALADDPSVKDALRRGATVGVFYIESPGMRSLLRKLDCQGFLNLVAASSVIRPGVAESGMMQEYILRHRHPERIPPLHPILGRLLAETHGVMVYQEDVIRVANEMGNLSLAEGDTLRRMMSGKSRGQVSLDVLQRRFMAGALTNGVTPELAERTWQQMESFCGYAFCKAHSASYAVLSLQLLWLKCHYPARFMAAVLDNRGGFYGPYAYVSEARRLGVHVLAPDIDQSTWNCVVINSSPTSLRSGVGGENPRESASSAEIFHRGDIILGFSFIKNLSYETGCAIEEARKQSPFQGISDFLARVRLSADEFGGLVACGAMRRFGAPAALRWEWHIASGGNGLFSPDIHPPEFTKRMPTRGQQARMEAASLDLMLSAHPLEFFDLPRPLSHSRVLPISGGRKIRCAGVLIAWKSVTTKKQQRMKFLTLEDRDGFFEVTVFPECHRTYGHLLLNGTVFVVEGKVDCEQGVPSIIAAKIMIPPLLRRPSPQKIIKSNRPCAIF